MLYNVGSGVNLGGMGPLSSVHMGSMYRDLKLRFISMRSGFFSSKLDL